MDINSAEQHLLAACISDPSLTMEIQLPESPFSSSTHQSIWDALQRMIRHNEPVAPFTLANRLEETTGRGGWIKPISEMVQWAPPRRIALEAVKVVQQGAKLRSLQNIGAEIELAVREQRVDAIDEVIRKLMRIETHAQDHSHTLRDGVTAALRRVEDRFETKGKLPGITTGLNELNGVLFGWMPTRMYVIGARPAMGKTALLLNFAITAAREGFVGVVSGEQDFTEVCERFMAIQGRIPGDSLQTGQLTDDEWDNLRAAVVNLARLPMSIFDKPGMTIDEVCRQAREWKFRNNMHCLFVDYLQLIRGSDKKASKIDQTGEVSRALKNLAKELQIPVVVLAQVNRECEKRPDKRPGVHDLANSGEIERDADAIMTLYRDEVYNSESINKGIAEISIQKNRHGGTKNVFVQFSARDMRFQNLAWSGSR